MCRLNQAECKALDATDPRPRGEKGKARRLRQTYGTEKRVEIKRTEGEQILEQKREMEGGYKSNREGGRGKKQRQVTKNS